MDNRQQRQIDSIFCTKIRLYPSGHSSKYVSFVQYWHCAIASFSIWYSYSLNHVYWTPVSLDRVYFLIDEFYSSEYIISFFKKFKYDLVFFMLATFSMDAEPCSSSSSPYWHCAMFKSITQYWYCTIFRIIP